MHFHGCMPFLSDLLPHYFIPPGFLFPGYAGIRSDSRTCQDYFCLGAFSVTLPLHGKYFSYLLTLDSIPSFRTWLFLYFLKKYYLTSLSKMCMPPTSHMPVYQPISFKINFLAFITIWNQPINQLINLYILCFYLSVSLPSTPIEWEKNFHLC